MRQACFILLCVPLLVFPDIGSVVITVDLPLEQPFGMTRIDGDLLIADRADGRVFRFDMHAKTYTHDLTLPCSHPWGIAADDTGLWIADREHNRIIHYHLKTGRVDRVLRDLETDPYGLAWDGTSLWATSGRHYVRLDPTDGTELETFEGPGRETTGIDFDGSYLWLGERYDDHLACATPEGVMFGVLPAPAPYPAGICRVDSRLWLVDFQERKLYALDIGKKAQPVYRGEPHHRKVRFSYSLTNRGPSDDLNTEMYVSLPGDGPSQRLLKPLEVFPQDYLRESDVWGQNFAVLRQSLPALQELSLGYSAVVETRDLNYFILPQWVESLKSIPAEIRRRYLVDGHKLDIHHAEVRKTVGEVVGDETNPFWIAFKIHRYLHLNMKYKRTGGWNMAPTVLKRGNGSCSEFTFAFIAMARAAGLPARYEAGLVVRGDDGSIDRVYHRWAQVYLPPFGWVPVDPSRGIPATAMEVAESFGSLSHRFFITTHSGGDSPYLGWTYNYHSAYDYSGRAVVDETSEAKWFPVDESHPRDNP